MVASSLSFGLVASSAGVDVQTATVDVRKNQSIVRNGKWSSNHSDVLRSIWCDSHICTIRQVSTAELGVEFTHSGAPLKTS